MRRVSRESPFFFPFTEGTTKQLFTDLIVPATDGYFVTLMVKNNFGGGRAIPMFFIDNYRYLAIRWGFGVVETKFLFVNPDDLEDGSKIEYLKLVFLRLGGKDPSSNYSQLVRDIRDLIEKKEERIVFFLRAFNYLDFADKSFWGSFRSIISGLENISVVFVAYSGGYG